MLVRPLEIAFHLQDVRTRLPFRFGVHTLTEAPLCVARVLVETPEGIVEGFSGELLVPKWFEKNPAQSIADDLRRLTASLADTAALALAAPRPATVHAHVAALTEARIAPAPRAERLMRGQAVYLLERALIDAACRAARAPFFRALRDPSLLGHPPEHAALLAPAPRHALHLRHTVGMLDALRAADVPASARVNDGLPETLEDDIRRFGLTHFKLKLSGDIGADVDRLLAIADILRGVENPRITLDGNEQFASITDLLALLSRLAEAGSSGGGRSKASRGRESGGALLLAHLLLIEQPLSRTNTFDPAATAGLDRLSTFASVIIDEADAEADAFGRAIALGYRGVSIKNCKGVFRALANHALCREALPPGRLFQSAEDLTNLPLLALQQDLATASALGVTHIERNGHHYFRGLSHLSPAAQSLATLHHRDLYEAVSTPAGPLAQLRITNGTLSTTSLHAAESYACAPVLTPHLLDNTTPIAD